MQHPLICAEATLVSRVYAYKFKSATCAERVRWTKHKSEQLLRRVFFSLCVAKCIRYLYICFGVVGLKAAPPHIHFLNYDDAFVFFFLEKILFQLYNLNKNMKIFEACLENNFDKKFGQKYPHSYIRSDWPIKIRPRSRTLT